MKKSIALIITFAMAVTMFAIPVSAAGFPDLPENHWAYGAVSTLVADGTIGGYEDGTFRPDGTVSRAEFVKMIGKGSELSAVTYTDVPAGHWAYDYVMYSGLEGSGTDFRPDEAITRRDVIRLIWKRAGSPAGAVAPGAVTGYGDDAAAIAWGYAHGVMIGDDGLNLRLNDGLSRAEGAALIVRARELAGAQKKGFLEQVDAKIPERIYNSLLLFDDKAYDPNATITNSEMVQAALRYGQEKMSTDYLNVQLPETLLDVPNAKSLYAASKEYLGEAAYSAEYAAKEATVQDTLIAFVYNMMRKAHAPVLYGDKDNYYSDVSGELTSMANYCLTYAYQKNIHLYADGTLHAGDVITLEELAAILVQLETLVGSQTAYSGNDKADQQLRLEVSGYPSNYADYQCILADVPNTAYQVPFSAENENTPKDFYDFGREYSYIFTGMLQSLQSKLEKQSGADLKITYFPSMACESDQGVTLRVRIEVISCGEGATVQSVFAGHCDPSLTLDLSAGTVLYGDITTGQRVSDLYMTCDYAKLVRIVAIQ